MSPILHLDWHTELIAKPIKDYFTDAIFGPLLAYLHENGVQSKASDQAIGHEKENPSAVRQALLTGAIWYANGVFSGRFNARISRELRRMGATLSGGVFHLSEIKLPADIKAAAVLSAQQSEALHKGVIDLINQMQANAPQAPLGIETGPEVEKIVSNLNEQFSRTVPAEEVSDAPASPAAFVSARANQILQIQIQEPIRNFTAQQLADLRARVQRNVIEGGRSDRLAQIIETRYGVAKRRAEFIGDQETSLLVSQYRERRYKSIGVNLYKWSTSHDERVRKDHRLLNGTVHDWANKPVTNRKTGARNHPGQDFRCRCVPIPIAVPNAQAA